ncbi:hypothetical protein D0N43_24780 [Klebsiella aerogenes]|uniref:Uncharacterized protein n=1 Tax=Klebsiella aerogenes (strain ATCC 13048 / DSM 30053 / CCUG 1429 / JCM 1235 / KCTC 2190 / NBRC 13534 / NCIMB 10102 / NCTC 10006 / CDC 819-56) TaxID=1028307 RepID=A0A0H3FSB1_KLEAK|nr:hypothetical protein EAE_18215 [Klebsiella aerogenes KCTC 2190]QEU18625.1 hypothetical protein FOB49_08225 [Klebsiella aerogenes]RFP70853.1 hypothetical protein D0N43_24780 [Klebsiella aerogenes]
MIERVITLYIVSVYFNWLIYMSFIYLFVLLIG